MRKLFLILAVMISGNVLAEREMGFDHQHRSWTSVLKSYRSEDGLFRYRQLKDDLAKNQPHPFSSYLAELSSIDFKTYATWTGQQQKAFLINAYNAFTVQLIISHYPVKSIKKIGGFFSKPWKLEFFSLLGGKIKSLDPIEHEWLRPNFKDYRIHAAVNCASVSCPELRGEAYMAERIDQQLDDQMAIWLKDPKRNQFESKSQTLYLSKIFDWYGEDFEKWGGGVVKVIAKYWPDLSGVSADKLRVKYLDYDWGLNEKP